MARSAGQTQTQMQPQQQTYTGGPATAPGQYSFPGGYPGAYPSTMNGAPATTGQPGPPGFATPSPGSIAGGAPAPVNAFGPTAQVNPTYGAPTTVNPIQAQRYLQQYLRQLNTAVKPEFFQQDQALNDSLAARGITNSGSAAQLQNNLFGQQAAAYAAQAEPMISQGFGYAQQDTMQNAANAQQMTLANQVYANQASALNAGYYNQAQYTNEQNYNAYKTMLEQQGYNTYDQVMQGYLNSYAPSPSVEGLYNTAVGGTYNLYGDVYGAAASGQGNALGGVGQGLGTYFGDAAIASGAGA